MTVFLGLGGSRQPGDLPRQAHDQGAALRVESVLELLAAGTTVEGVLVGHRCDDILAALKFLARAPGGRVFSVSVP